MIVAVIKFITNEEQALVANSASDVWYRVNQLDNVKEVKLIQNTLSLISYRSDSVKTILRLMCGLLGTNEDDILNGKRSKRLSNYRKVITYFLNKNTTLSLTDIAEYLNYGDHTSIKYNIKSVEDSIKDGYGELYTLIQKLEGAEELTNVLR